MAGRIGISGAVTLALLAGLLTVSAPGAARADALAIAPMKVAMRMPAIQVTQTPKFNWLAKRGPKVTATLASARRTPAQIGSGSWICSPAGFGKKSRCYSN